MTMYRLTYIIFILSFHFTLAQNPIFPIDESGKYIFSEVIEVDSVSKDELIEKGSLFIQQLKVHNSTQNNLIQDLKNYILSNKGSFVVHNLGGIKNSVSGIVIFDMTLEFKDGKCRYTITNFTFNPYERNRYGKFESEAGKYTPLEQEATRLNRKAWAKHRKEVYSDSQTLISQLNEHLTYQKNNQPEKVIKNDNW